MEDTLSAIQGRKDYYLKKRQAVKEGTYDAEADPEAASKKASSSSNGPASTHLNGVANGDLVEDFEHVSGSFVHGRRMHWFDMACRLHSGAAKFYPHPSCTPVNADTGVTNGWQHVPYKLSLSACFIRAPGWLAVHLIMISSKNSRINCLQSSPWLS